MNLASRAPSAFGALSRSLALAAVLQGCAGAPAQPPPDDVESTPAPSAEAAPPQATSAPSASEVASSDPPPVETAASELPPYPADSAKKGQDEVEKMCINLVYKKGCDETRTGQMSVRVSLRDDGSVLSTHTSKNDISNEADVIEQCVLDAVSRLHFDPPTGTASSFTMKLVFGDKC
jgi:hypothetical protein